MTAKGMPVKPLNKEKLLELLDLYDSVTKELHALNDREVAGLIKRIGWHRADVVRALAALNAA